jgi:hypothetical protein
MLNNGNGMNGEGLGEGGSGRNYLNKCLSFLNKINPFKKDGSNYYNNRNYQNNELN